MYYLQNKREEEIMEKNEKDMEEFNDAFERRMNNTFNRNFQFCNWEHGKTAMEKKFENVRIDDLNFREWL
jgi:hypothetical protein